MRIQRGFLIASILGVSAVSAVMIAMPAGRIRVEADKGTQLRIRTSGDGNVTLVSAAKIFSRDSTGVDVLAPAEFAIKRYSPYYIRFDAADSAAIINVSAEGLLAFGFGETGSRYPGVSVVCGSPRESQVRSLAYGASLANRSCPD